MTIVTLIKNNDSYKIRTERICNYIKTNISDYQDVLVLGNQCIYYNKLDVIPKHKYIYLPYNIEEYDNIIRDQKMKIINGEYNVIIKRPSDNYLSDFIDMYTKCYECFGEEVWIKK